jgi:streptogrisin C
MTIRRQWIAALAVGVFLVATPGTGEARSGQTELRGDLTAAVATVASWPADMVAAVERDLHRDRRQIIEHQAFVTAAKPVAERLKVKLGGGFGGSWLADSGTELVVAVTRRSLIPSVRAAGATPVLVKRSEADLAAVRDRLTGTPGVGGTISSWHADPKSNQVVVRAVDQAAAQRWVKASGVDTGAVRIELGDPLRTQADGGQGYNAAAGECSIGFGARRGTNELGFLTAGHCGPTNSSTRNPAGTFTRSVFPGNDVGFVRLQDVREATPFIRGPAGSRIGITDTAIVGEGVRDVCHSGLSTGWQCGRVLATGVIANVFDAADNFLGQVDRVSLSDACSKPGDSGGPWVFGTLAIGIHSAGSTTTCAPGHISGFVAINQVGSDIKVLTVQPQLPPDVFRVTSLACRNSPPGTPTIRCNAAWEGSADPATAHWSISPYQPIGFSSDPLLRRSLMQFTCNTDDNDIEFEYEVTVVVVDSLGRMASKTGLAPCIAPW